MGATGRPLHFASMLDLGCGTGLGGAAFRAIADRLVGVDLSPAMIERAEGKGLYDRLATADLTDCLTAEACSGAEYDLVLAPSGLFAFTVETHPGDGVQLLPTLRYAHGEPYLRRALTAAGLTLGSISRAAVRSEKGAPVDSLVVVALASTPPHAPATSEG
jgi:predicted TPR repeat methyltransferase